MFAISRSSVQIRRVAEVTTSEKGLDLKRAEGNYMRVKAFRAPRIVPP
jgi:hypothetical protein